MPPPPLFERRRREREKQKKKGNFEKSPRFGFHFTLFCWKILSESKFETFF
jgi:hypothetical protein